TRGEVAFFLNLPEVSAASSFDFNFSEGLAAWPGTDGRLGFLDKTGSFVIPPTFAQVIAFSEGVAAVSLDNEGEGSAWGYINAGGAWVIEPQFGYARAFQHGLAEVNLETRPAYRQGYIDHSGKVIWQAP
ncbi:MAG TPA: WG repeat-containing protein, partial [Thermoleophilia bacterium]|nr:WG repeat-containing protein [Thermoleophilia bacterium]